MSNFTPIASALGGALIGVSATLLLTLNGKVAGVSGIFGGLLDATGEDREWRASFLAGLLLAGTIAAWLQPGAIGRPPALPLGLMVIAGLLVGIGTQLASGCTSGHGVCGISRGSKRSVAATLAFVSAGVVTVHILRHVLRAFE
jgi:hypothetical protein